MPLVPETKVAETRKQSVSGTHWSGEPRGYCLKLSPLLQFRPAFLEPTPRKEFSINALIFLHSLLFTFSHTRPTHSLQCDFRRENYHSLISTNSSIPPQKMYTPCNHSLTCYTFLVRFFPASKTTEISSNHRKKKVNNMGEDTFLLI